MAMHKLPNDIQSLFCASTQICTYKRAVEELVYNSLDAESTSIAIRVNIEQNTIQVIDNGFGVSKCNFRLLGQRYATSKCVDLNTLKSAPNKYGYRGESLASIIQVSQYVKITSRPQDSEETWYKSFHKGKEQRFSAASQRPSKGTTVEVKGFLYNLKIQKKTVNPLNEINGIKDFLEHLALIHNNTSLSLRDDAKNEIIFKLHKNRGIYQTLSSLFGIYKKDVQELKVEKNQYKVTAIIDKKCEKSVHQHWIYLNGKLLQNSKVHKIVDESLSKYLHLNLQFKRKSKSKIPSQKEEDGINVSGIPFYFIFISCPYYDYDINYTPKTTVVEFKNWESINKLIEKMAKFFAKDVNQKDEKVKPVKNQMENQQKTEETRDQVKNIMVKILGSNPKKIRVSQMQNGIKGKIVKRKPKRNTEKLILPKKIPSEKGKINITNKTAKLSEKCNEQSNCDNIRSNIKPNKMNTSKTTNNKDNLIKVPFVRKGKQTNHNKKDIKVQKRRTLKEKELKKHKIRIEDKLKQHFFKYNPLKQNNKKQIMDINVDKDILYQKSISNKKINKLSKPTKLLQKIKQTHKKLETSRKIHKLKHKTDPILKKFNQDPTGSVKERCNILAKEVDDLIGYKEKRKRNVFINETVRYSNVIKNNKKYSVRKKIGEIIIHDYIPKPPYLSSCTFDDCIWEKANPNLHKSSYDLVHTVLRTQETRNSCTDSVNVSNNVCPEASYDKQPRADCTEHNDHTQNIPLLPRLTFESHRYMENQSHNYNTRYCELDKTQKKRTTNLRFITTRSKDNFKIPTMNTKKLNIFKSNFEHMDLICKRKRIIDTKFQNRNESSYTIEFSQTNENCIVNGTRYSKSINSNENQNENYTYNTCQTRTKNEININGGCTYTKNKTQDEENIDQIEDSTEKMLCNDVYQNNYFIKNGILKDNNQYNEHNVNVVFISKSQEPACDNTEIQTTFNSQVNPIDVCEAIHSPDQIDKMQMSSMEWNDSLLNADFEVNSILCDINAHTQINFHEPIVAENILDKTLLNLNIGNTNGQMGSKKIPNKLESGQNLIKTTTRFEGVNYEMGNVLKNNIGSWQKSSCELNVNLNKYSNHFNFRNRLRFVPKGMSQIFTNCQSRKVSHINLEQEDYYKDTIYNDFANNVQQNCNIFEPEVQNVKDLTTKAIEKVNNKLNKDNSSLIFNGNALQTAEVFRQVDNKFIAAKVTGRIHNSQDKAEYLVFFDQHAVHERIRLENNLSDYCDNNQWKSMPLDNIRLKLTKDEILYLHNYKDKFNQLGLQWTILSNDEIAISAIPEAIFGKNPRQVEIVMKAVKNLIVEEVNAIKSQSGCISLYPKSIMDLVFSEACRYAIKFGDRLSKPDCRNLLNSLSECKTPFQCAHGRPVMAVLMDIKSDLSNYKINITKVQEWIKLRSQIKRSK